MSVAMCNTPDSEFEELPVLGSPPQQADRPRLDAGGERKGGFKTDVPVLKPYLEVVHADQKPKFVSSGRRGFVPDFPVKATVVEVERTDACRSFNPYLYTVELEHAGFTWAVYRRYNHFLKLHTALTVHRNVSRASTKPKTKSSSSGDVTEDEVVDGVKRQRPRFPVKPDFMLGSGDLDNRRLQLESYLNCLLRCEEYANHHATLEFFEVSELSFVNGLHVDVKAKEGIVMKRLGDNRSVGRIGRLLRNLCKPCFAQTRWSKIWCIVQETCIVGLDPKSGQLRLVLLFDSDFAFSAGAKQTGWKNGMRLSNLSRTLVIKCDASSSKHHRGGVKEWTEAVERAATNAHGRQFVQVNRFGSFAPVRERQRAYWFVDGQSLMEAVAVVIDNAKEEIFIADWWLSPEIYLNRSCSSRESFRLDNLLSKKAEQGVKVFILLYKELQLALTLDSLYTKRALVSRGGKNIRVMRHPDRGGVDVNGFLWAHHEKLVVVDQSYAFVGGIDLCYGRWDNHNHRLTDMAAAADDDAVSVASDQRAGILIGPPNTSTRPAAAARGHAQGRHVAHALRAAHEISVAPIRAVAGGVKEDDKTAVDADDESEGGRTARSNIKKKLKLAMIRARHGLRRDSTTSSKPSEDSDSSVLSEPADRGVSRRAKARFGRGSRSGRRRDAADRHLFDAPEKDGNYNTFNKGFDNRTFVKSLEEVGDGKKANVVWRGKDYVNFIVRDVFRPDLPDADNVDRRTTPRMPWHDVSTMVQGSSARDVARHFVQRWNAVKMEKAKSNPAYPLLVPKAYGSLRDPPIRLLENVRAANVNVQVLRSCSEWSAGIDEVESSIHNAAVAAIAESKHFVYVENQFFITSASASSSSNGSEVRNGIGRALYDRISKAHREKKTFRVYVLLPLLPAFQGRVACSATGNALRVILHYNYASMCRGENSLMARLRKGGMDPEEYVSFCSLRTWSELRGVPVTELVYVHSKLMIVDDEVVICGSANINDRSLLGSRDSEVCVRIQDVEFVPVTLKNGRQFSSGRYAGKLRRRLMREHLGLLPEAMPPDETDERRFGDDDVHDCLDDSFFHGTWNSLARVNARLFDKAFLCSPSDDIRTLEECRLVEEKTPLAEIDRYEARRILEDVKGNLVRMPLDFLDKENLLPSYASLEGIIPAVTWT